MKIAESAPFTPEDVGIWVVMIAKHGPRLAAVSRLDDYRAACQMLWIQKQAPYRARHERQYGRGKPIGRLHPLARIGMGSHA